jgi:hypothetical protein
LLASAAALHVAGQELEVAGADVDRDLLTGAARGPQRRLDFSWLA